MHPTDQMFLRGLRRHVTHPDRFTDDERAWIVLVLMAMLARRHQLLR